MTTLKARGYVAFTITKTPSSHAACAGSFWSANFIVFVILFFIAFIFNAGRLERISTTRMQRGTRTCETLKTFKFDKLRQRDCKPNQQDWLIFSRTPVILFFLQ
jgi:hypothetical protein